MFFMTFQLYCDICDIGAYLILIIWQTLQNAHYKFRIAFILSTYREECFLSTAFLKFEANALFTRTIRYK